jgi:diaminohydroxyphosphoribosylaminopyrimidine deaminase/5-amino-6-(5-phosphoribosylamino)uracil reductase
MRQALELAARGRGRVAPNPLVGAVVVVDEKIIGRGYHARCGEAHAETAALLEAGEAARGADLYVTLEPCNHDGRTGACTRAILDAGIATVFVAAADTNPGVTGGGSDFLRTNGIEVITGLLEEEALFQNRFFFTTIHGDRPYIILKWAMSLDGSTAAANGESRWISGPESRARVHALRAEVDAVAVGVGTVIADDPLLTCREIPDGRNPVRLIIDPELRIPLKARLLQTLDQAPCVLIAGDRADSKTRQSLEKAGAEVLSVGAGPGGLDLATALKELKNRDWLSILVEGGGITAGSLMDAGLADEIMVFCAPCLIGGDAPHPLRGRGIAGMDARIAVETFNTETLGDDILIQGRIIS